MVDPDLRSAVLTVEPTEPGGHGRCWPSLLRAGDVVSVVAPSGPYDRDRVRQGSDILRSWGLDVHHGDRPAGPDQRLSYISADDQSRADDFVAAWCSPNTGAVWAARGGYGAQRMIDLIDFDALRAAGPKLLIGFSDITALHVRIGRELNMITIHGPVVGSVAQLSDPPSVTALQKLIMAPPVEPGMVLASGHVVVAGTAIGRLWGGNLSVLASDIGIEPPPDEPGILLLEDIREDSYRIDRMLTQLARARWLDQVTGVALGQFEGNPTSELLEHVVADRLARLGVPVVTGLEVGHGGRNLALPLGAEVRLSS